MGDFPEDFRVVSETTTVSKRPQSYDSALRVRAHSGAQGVKRRRTHGGGASYNN